MRDIEKYGNDYKTKNDFEAASPVPQKEGVGMFKYVTIAPSLTTNIGNRVRLGTAFFIL